MGIMPYRATVDSFSSGAPNICHVERCAAGTGTNPAVCAELMPVVRQQAFAAGGRIAVPDGSAAFVAVGALRMDWILDDGRRQVLGFHFRGDQLDEPSGHPGIRCVALTPGMMYLVDDTDLARCGRWHGKANDWRLNRSARSLDRMTAQVMLLGKFTAAERIAAFLVNLAERTGLPKPNGAAFELPMKRGDIADYLGLNTETVSRQISRLKSEGIVDLPKADQVVVQEMARLRSLSPFPLADAPDRESDAA